MPTTLDSTLDSVLSGARSRIDEARSRLTEMGARLDQEARAGVERYGAPVLDLTRKTADRVGAHVPDVTEAVNELVPRVKTFVSDIAARVGGASTGETSTVTAAGKVAEPEASAEG
jgi:hypothetical protein